MTILKVETKMVNEKTVEQMIREGYRRTSWAHGIVSRIDREDWIEHMAKHFDRAPADFYLFS